MLRTIQMQEELHENTQMQFDNLGYRPVNSLTSLVIRAARLKTPGGPTKLDSTIAGHGAGHGAAT